MPHPVWLFDLDNTLHNASHAIFPAINTNMNAYMARVLGKEGVDADPDVVNAARLAYWKRYGATLLGMIKHHQVRAEDFLREAHTFEELTAMIRAERGLARLLKRLPGRKILLTNAPRGYSREVVRHLGLHRHFAGHIAIESMRVHRQLRPKPSRLLLHKLLAREGVAAHNCILVEDTLDNLKAAKTLGMRTAWITQYLASKPNLQQRADNLPSPKFTKRPVYVDVKVKSVRKLPANLHRLR
ncbi:MAG TPA: pyrimidine 5'-nucleotidase [Noviherbaspirillum sp.]|jgi:putative hydrolase of the HAD superfamily|uniref:pyrimidine 5'-nucleotidase n=1 Tax=Noviherbaspirillum sp. TaxID=1926288 RepID=UPI002DDD1A35|nr:pyrimidine 5'-nucleotidase [Noviherbaspirillum sp.]HEV2611131.1 pyrimidine 5'-nucleotidase [Noviherbaspirillum sp.]